MDIKLHNSATGEKEVFVPINADDVRVYFCGPTVYDLVHIGNLRAFMTADILVRTLRTKYPTSFVRNITDIDDKIIQRASENGEQWHDLAERYTVAFQEDTARAGLLAPDFEPKATNNIEGMKELARILIKSGKAYESNGSVYFDSSTDRLYGHLSHRQNMEGEVQEENSDKKSPKDFAILKAAKPGEPYWDSEWGKIRPGWHTECAVMSQSFFGEQFDIHGGGQDLFFPHHECEDTLCRAVNDTDESMARYWIHNSMLNVDGRKMSKSLGNFLTIREVTEKVHPEVLRMFLLSSHYRSAMNFTWDAIEETKKHLDRLYRFARDGGKEMGDEQKAFLYNDLDTPGFLARLNVLANLAATGDKNASYELYAAGKAVGLLGDDNYFKGDADVQFVERLIARRSKAKSEKDWASADTLRKILDDHGIILEDTKEGTTWRIK